MSSINIEDYLEINELDEKFVFFSFKRKNATELADFIFDYFFSEELMFRHVNYLEKIPFKKERKNLVQLYKFLDLFLDDEITEILNKADYENINVIIDECKLISDNGDSVKIRLDKIGKIGEFIFSIILENYFSFSCIIPKSNLTTNKNMSVYGIDVLYFDEKDNFILFGESKVCKNIGNGITQINESLLKYEKMIKDEFMLIFTRDKINQLNCLKDIYKDEMELAFDFFQFVDLAKINKIGIPLFIAHGTETKNDEIFDKMKSIAKKDFFGLNTKYYIISFPIVDKNEFSIAISKKIKQKKEEYYES